MEGSEQKNTIVIPALLQESSPGDGVTGMAEAMTGAGGTRQKAIAKDQVRSKEGTS